MNIINPITDEVIVRENEMITDRIARKLEDLQIEKIRVRSPLTCEASLGVCQVLRHGPVHRSAGREGMAVGIIAAQSIGEPGTQLTMRTFHTGGTAVHVHGREGHQGQARGIVKYVDINLVIVEDGKKIALSRNGEIPILDPKGRELEKYKVPDGAIDAWSRTVRRSTAARCSASGIRTTSRFWPRSAAWSAIQDIDEGETMRIETDPSGHVRRTIIEHKGELHPQIIIEDAEGKILGFHYIPERASIEVDEGSRIRPARSWPRRRAKAAARRTSPAVCRA